jgi:hypothetical protein
VDDGSITMFWGAIGGLSFRSALLSGAPHFGVQLPVKELLVADLNGDHIGDVVASAPTGPDGLVVFLPGTSGGMTLVGHKLLSAGILGRPDDQRWHGFGHSVAAGDITGDGVADLLIGDVGLDAASMTDVGGVYLVPGTSAGPTGAGARVVTQGTGFRPSNRRGTPDASRPEQFDYFGASVTILNLDGSGPLDAVIGSPYEYVAGDTDEPSGLLTRLVVQPARPTGGTRRPAWQGPIAFGSSWSGQNLSSPSLAIRYLGQSLLHG